MARLFRASKLFVLAVAMVATACSSVGEPITVRVDYEHDEFATQFIRFFPNQIQVHPGDTVRFIQDWTGEAHTVSLGTIVNEAMEVAGPLLEQYRDLPEDQIPEEALEAFFEAECTVPALYSECGGPPEEGLPAEGEAPAGEEGIPTETVIDPIIALPCVVAAGAVPESDGPCPEQELAPFQGTETFYNSGFLGFDTEGENRFDLQLSETIAPGTYNFFCAVHGLYQSGAMEVVPADQPIPEPAEVNAATRQELLEEVEPFQQVFARAQEGTFVIGGQQYSGRFSGLVDDRVVDGLLNEFVPSEIEAQVGEPITWLMFGPHTISFDVPEYFPIYDTNEEGEVIANEAIFYPAGGSPEVEEPPPGEPLIIDGGSWDGNGFRSSGVLYSDEYVEYTLRITTPGTYPFACLIHPPMVGTVTVEP